VLINLVPEFLAVLQAPDREAAFEHYLSAHRAVLSAYWHNFVLDLESPQAKAVIAHALNADRSDLHELLESTDVEGIVEDAIAQAEDLLHVDRPTDVYLMVGMGGANAGELVVVGRRSPAVAAQGNRRARCQQFLQRVIAMCEPFVRPRTITAPTKALPSSAGSSPRSAADFTFISPPPAALGSIRWSAGSD
jgi:hypothetical protein